MKILSEIGPPQNAVPSLASSAPPGLNSVKTVLESENATDVPNGGRVIILGYKMGDHIGHWCETIMTALNGDSSAGSKSSVNMSEWYFIDVEPVTESLQYDESPQPVIPSGQKATNHSVFRLISSANKDLHRTLMSLCEKQHQLACTLVQNIPMKEDTSNTQSAMYGVELIHPRSALNHISQAGLLPLMTMTHRPYCGFSSCIGIRWVTPKQTHDIEYYNTKSAHRVTTADVCHRASCCLANFVLEGRCVVLEIDQGLVPPAPLGLPEFHQEMLLLTSHSGVLHLHGLHAHRDPVFDPPQRLPSICAVAGKKATSKMRAADFCQLILASRLVPVAPQAGYSSVDRALKEAEHHTRYWPELSSDTIIFNKPLMPKVAEILSHKHLDITEKSSCIGFLQQMIFDQGNAEKSGAGKKSGTEGKAFKTELEVLLWLQQDRSPAHKDVLDSFEVFSGCLTGLVDVPGLLRTPLEHCGSAGNNQVHSGLARLDRLLANGGAIIRDILKPSGESQTAPEAFKSRGGVSGGSRKHHSRPEQGTLTLRETINVALESSLCARKRKRFDGELSAVNGVTELYVQTLMSSAATDPRKEPMVL